MKTETRTVAKTQEKSEILQTQERLKGFDALTSAPWIAMTAQHGVLNHRELLSIANSVIQVAGFSSDRRIGRREHRRRDVLLKWFDENWGVIKPYMPYIIMQEQ